MHSPIDKALSARLRRLPTYCADEEPSRSTVYARAAELATRLSIGAAFKERLTSDLGSAIGVSHAGRLTRAGRRLATLTVDEYDRAESRRETIVKARATVGSAELHWRFAADEAAARLSLAGGSGESGAAPLQLLRVDAASDSGVAPRVHVHHRALTALDRRSIGSRLDATALCHVLVGLLPEFLDEGWEMHEKIVDVCLRNQKRARGRARSVFLCRLHLRLYSCPILTKET